jgi:DNA-binding transcriptional ArsR family regulator
MGKEHSQQRPCYGEDESLPDKSSLRGVVSLLSAVGHPVRLLALIALRRRGPLSVGELRKITDTEQSHMSHQLRVLREARLVRTERRGKQIFYELYDHHVAHIIEDAVQHAGSSDCHDAHRTKDGPDAL